MLLLTFLFYCTLFLCSSHRHILDASLQDSKMLISRERIGKTPKNTVTLLAMMQFNS